MRVSSSWGMGLGVLALAFATAQGCRGGGAAVKVGPDGGHADAADAREVGEAGSEAPGLDLAVEIPADADASPAEVPPAAEAGPEAPAVEAGADVPRDAPAEKAEAGVDAKPDLPIEKPPATASWTIAPNPMCTAAGAGCMDTGAVGGYQVTASGTCPTASSVQLWFPGGAAAIAPGNYTVKAASGILDVINMQTGMVGVLTERDEGATHRRFWGRAGTVTVSVSGAGRHAMFSGLTIREETTAAMTTLTGDVTCP